MRVPLMLRMMSPRTRRPYSSRDDPRTPALAAGPPSSALRTSTPLTPSCSTAKGSDEGRLLAAAAHTHPQAYRLQPPTHSRTRLVRGKADAHDWPHDLAVFDDLHARVSRQGAAGLLISASAATASTKDLFKNPLTCVTLLFTISTGMAKPTPALVPAARRTGGTEVNAERSGWFVCSRQC